MEHARNRGAGLAARVQLLANVAVIAASIGVLWLVAQRLVPRAARGPDIYAVGETVGPVEGVNFAASQRTLVMALREDCRFCQQSVPFYKTLTRRLREKGAQDLQVVVVSTDEPDKLSRYLRANEIEVNQVAQYQLGSLKIPGTPFLFLVDATGKVAREWRGMLPPAKEREVFAELGLAVSQ